ncbi:MAG TPA: DUF2085 domain-containing protein [Anaerolineae bacterium]|nr:DUF2085 domain-containing protein [Anaerolineae bacterium]
MDDQPLDQRVQAIQPSFTLKLERWVNRGVEGFVRHWLAFFNLLFLVYVGLPLLAPVLMELGAEAPARVIYTIYRPACHQLPERSFFLFGEQPVYSRAELPANGVADSDNIFVRRNYIGDPEYGYKVAICERDVAIYGSMFLMGLIFALARGHLPRLKARYVLLFALPMALDGLTQLVGLRESSWALRVITGGLFGIGLVWFAYPYIEESMKKTVIRKE